MMRFLRVNYRRFFRFKRFWAVVHSGKGFKQGNGTDIKVRVLTIGEWFRVITDINVNTEGSWLDNLKSKL